MIQLYIWLIALFLNGQITEPISLQERTYPPKETEVQNKQKDNNKRKSEVIVIEWN